MEYNCIKTGRKFTTKQGFINHIRLNYPNQEEAYLSENGITETPLCKYCDKNKVKFNNFFSGYSDHCNALECKIKLVKETNERIAEKKRKGKPGYDEFIIDNKEAIKELLINKVPFDDTFTGRLHVDSYFIKQYSPSKLKNIKFLELRTCELCGGEFDGYFYSTSYLCSKLCKKRKASILGNNIIRENHNVIVDRVLSIKDYSYEVSLGNYVLIREKDTPDYKAKRIIRKSFIGYDKIVYNSDYNIWCSIKYKNGKYYNATLYALYNFGAIENIYPNIEYYCDTCGKGIETNTLNFYYDDGVTYHRTNMKYKPRFCDNKCYTAAIKAGKYPISEHTKIKSSNSTKTRILNGTFTPKSNNRRTHWFTIDGKQYRSSWEYCFFLYSKFYNIVLEHERVRIKYYDTTSNKTRIYITDFLDSANRIIYEIKPQSQFTSFNDKLKYLQTYCLENNYSYELIDEYWFKGLRNEIKEYIMQEIPKDTPYNLHIKIGTLLHDTP